MGAQWKHAGRIANSSKKGAMIGKLVKEIIVATKAGDPNPDNNSRLRVAIEAAKKQSVPRDTIERAIKRGAGLLEPVVYELVTFEGFTPHRVPVIVECLTENRNRTAADIRGLFKAGQLGAMGAVAWMFDRSGVVEATIHNKETDIEGVAIEAGAQNVEPLDASEVAADQIGAKFICDPTDLDAVTKFLTQAGWSVTLSEIHYLAKNNVEVGEAEKAEVVEFLTKIDDNDDVHRLYTALK